MVSSQLLQLITLTIIPVLPLHTILFMELEYPYFNIQMKIVVELLKLLSMTSLLLKRHAVAHLPEAYTNVVPITAIKHNPPIPRQEGPNKATYELVSTAIEKEYE